MDTVISTIIGLAIYLAFVIGLAVSIGSIPFAIIVAAVSLMVIIDFIQSSREALKKRQNGNSTSH